MSNKIKYFGLIAEKIGVSSEYLSVEGKTISEFMEILTQKYPVIKNNSIKIAINHSIKNQMTLINEGDELAILPPFSGG